MSVALKRLTKELTQLTSEPLEGFILTDTTNIMCWKGIIEGPKDTPFENGKFPIQITFDEDYPRGPPSVKFLVSIFHPNIYRDGKICVDILQSQEWSPVQTVRTIVLSLRSLFMDPNPSSPANRDAAMMFMNNKTEYESKVREEIKKLKI
jgi:ubiquitin-conjugating enzyme E2 A